MASKQNLKHSSMRMWMLHYFNLFAGPTKSSNLQKYALKKMECANIVMIRVCENLTNRILNAIFAHYAFHPRSVKSIGSYNDYTKIWPKNLIHNAFLIIFCCRFVTFPSVITGVICAINYSMWNLYKSYRNTMQCNPMQTCYRSSNLIFNKTLFIFFIFILAYFEILRFNTKCELTSFHCAHSFHLCIHYEFVSIYFFASIPWWIQCHTIRPPCFCK